MSTWSVHASEPRCPCSLRWSFFIATSACSLGSLELTAIGEKYEDT